MTAMKVGEEDHRPEAAYHERHREQDRNSEEYAFETIERQSGNHKNRLFVP